MQLGAIERDAGVPAALAALAATLFVLGGAVVGVAAGASPWLSLAAAAGLLFLVLATRDLVAGLLLFTVLIVFDRTLSISSSGTTPVKVAGAVLLLAWLARIVSRRGRDRILLLERPLLSFAALGLLVWAFASSTWGSDSEVAVSTAFRLAQGVLLVFIVYTAFATARHVRHFVWAFLAGLLFAIALGFTAYARAVDNNGRLSGGFDDPNELAALLVPGIVFAGFGFVAMRGRRTRWLLPPIMAILGLGLVRTDSQAGLVALASALVLSLLFSGRARRTAVGAVATFVVAATAYYTFVAPPVAIQTITSEENTAARASLWTVAAQMAGDHPIGGVGSGNFTVEAPVYAAGLIDLPRADLVVSAYVVHNTYLQVLAELGAVGAALFLAVIVGAVTSTVQAVRRFAAAGDWELEMLARAILVGTVSMLVAYGFATNLYTKQLWLLLGLGLALSGASRGRVAAAQPRDRPPRLRSVSRPPSAAGT